MPVDEESFWPFSRKNFIMFVETVQKIVFWKINHIEKSIFNFLGFENLQTFSGFSAEHFPQGFQNSKLNCTCLEEKLKEAFPLEKKSFFPLFYGR